MKKRRKKMQKALSLLALTSFCATSTNALAMPSYNSSTQRAPSFLFWAPPQTSLSQLQAQAVRANPELAGSALLEDHLDRDVLYVSPATKKTQSGVYAPVNGAVNCPVFEGQYALTFRLPAQSEFESKAAAGVYSPYFDLQYGNYYRFGNLINTLTTKQVESELLKQKPEYAEYITAKDRLDLHVADIDAVKSKIGELETAVSTAVSLLGFAGPSTIEQARVALQFALDERAAKVPALLQEKMTLETAKKPLQEAYLVARKAWLPFDLDLNRLTEARLAAESAITTVNKIAQDTFGLNEKTLATMETKLVGTAQAGYSIWGNEAASMATAIGGGRYKVRQLPLFNVNLSSAVALNSYAAGSTAQSTESAADNVLQPKSVQFRNIGGPSAPIAGVAKSSDNWVFKTAAGKPLRPVEVTPSASSGTFRSDINQGVYCMGSSERGKPTRVSAQMPIGSLTKPWFVDSYTYKPKAQRVMAQSVALNYSYHVKSDPMSVVCTLDIKKSMDYVRNSGSWSFLWWGESWDETKRKSSMEDGLACITDENPSDSSPNSGDSMARLDALRTKALNEITVEFLQTYAKSWRTEVVVNQAAPAHESKFFNSIGTGLEAICGPNVYCKVTSIVLKSLDEIAGSHSGSTSHKEEFSGKISRNYKEQSFRTVKGDAIIDVIVDAP